MSALRDVADALVVDVPGDDLRAGGDRRHDRRLGAGVVALDVGRRVAFGVAQSLRFGERLAVGGTVVGHLREDVVGGAVDDAHHAGDRLAAQALAQRPHDGDAAGHRRLEQQVDAALVGEREQLDADVGEQLLVRRDDRLAPAESGGDQLTGRLDAADDLHHEVDVGVLDDGDRVVGELGPPDVEVAVAGEVAHGHLGDLEVDARARLDLLGPGGDEGHERAADVAAAEDTDAYR